MSSKNEIAIFAAGCFWGVEETFQTIPGVISTRVGYTGGHTGPNWEVPTYKQVCSGQTGHAEAIEITYDPEKISYRSLLEIFWKSHNPTTKNRQGVDVGTQYRSGIFYTSQDQFQDAVESKTLLEQSKVHRNPIVTEIMPATEFYPAEDYHQKYIEKSKI
ncbi:MAG: peptide-methionine (S)-S-oxide reductase MsrA [Promethearchaeota archaeon]